MRATNEKPCRPMTRDLIEGPVHWMIVKRVTQISRARKQLTSISSPVLALYFSSVYHR